MQYQTRHEYNVTVRKIIIFGAISSMNVIHKTDEKKIILGTFSKGNSWIPPLRFGLATLGEK